MRKGISLIEILVAIVVIGILFPAMGSVFVNAFRDWGRQRDFLQSFENARWALEFMSSEIRDGTAVSLTDDAEGAMAEHSLLNFIDPNPSSRKIYYWKGAANNILYRAVVGDSEDFIDIGTGDRQELAGNIVSAVFNVSPEGGEDGLVEIQLTFRPNPLQPEGPGNRNRSFMTKARPRN
jgi:prepilin-type N-terminal cleavage/methylation domain-containing protein